MKKKKSIPLRIIAVITSVLTLILSLTLGFFIVIQALFPASAIDLIGFKTFTVSYTKSMEPTLNYNDLIFIRRFDFMDLKEGDIIAFKTYLGTSTQTIIVAHRIIKIIDDDGVRYLFTMGDNIKIQDTIPVTVDGANDTNAYVGKFVGKSAFLGQTAAFLKSRTGIFVLCYNFIGIILIRVIGIIGDKRAKNTHKTE